MAENTAQQHREAETAFEDTVMTDEVMTNDAEAVPKKKRKKKSQAYCDFPYESKLQRYTRRMRAPMAKSMKVLRGVFCPVIKTRK